MDPHSCEAYHVQRNAVGIPFAAEIVQRLEDHHTPETDIEISLLESVPTMTAFACTATDALYRLIATRNDHRNDIRRIFSLFIVGSAVFDHICDREDSLFPELVGRISEQELKSALSGEATISFTKPGDRGLLAYVTMLVEDQVRICHELLSRTNQQEVLIHLEAFNETMIQIYHAELLSRPDIKVRGTVPKTVQRVWTEPLWAASLLVALTPDIRPGLNLNELHSKINAVGRLFSLIDDIVDLEEDWSTGSHNSVLERVRPHIISAESSMNPLWKTLLSDEVWTPYVNEITSLVSYVSDPLYEEDLACWLYSWLA